MSINKITIAGGGVLGCQIAFQAAYCGYDVTIWLRSAESVNRAKEKLEKLKNEYDTTINFMDTPQGKTKDNWAQGISEINNFNKEECLLRSSRALSGIKLTTDLKASLDNCDLLIESLVEDFDVKSGFYKKVAGLLPEKTVVATNSSTILPSKLAKYTGREDRFLSLHFSNPLYMNNLCEIMAHKKTDNKIYMEMMEFIKTIRVIGITVGRENPGYIVNSMLIPFLFSAADLYIKGTSDFQSIDLAWKLATGMPKGPFEIIDNVGIPTCYKIATKYLKIPSIIAPYDFKGICKLLKKYLDEGKYGKQNGEGFYKYY